MIKFEILWKLPTGDTDRKSANAIGKMLLIDLPNAGLPQFFNM